LREFFGFDENRVVLIVNGRLYEEIDFATLAQLRQIDVWSTEFIWRFVNERSTILHTRLAHVVFSFFVVDWWQMGVRRESSILPDDTDIAQASIVYNSPSSQRMIVELHVNPFTRQFQRVADCFRWLDERNIVRLRMVMIPKGNLPKDELAIRFYYRGAFSTNDAVLSFFDDAFSFRMKMDPPPGWILDLTTASFNTSSMRWRGRPEYAEYVLTRVLADQD
jgi:hypothetical protein